MFTEMRIAEVDRRAGASSCFRDALRHNDLAFVACAGKSDARSIMTLCAAKLLLIHSHCQRLAWTWFFLCRCLLTQRPCHECAPGVGATQGWPAFACARVRDRVTVGRFIYVTVYL